jgi:hypothetical protein
MKIAVFASIVGAGLGGCSGAAGLAPTTVTAQALLGHYRDSAGNCLSRGTYRFEYRSTSTNGDAGSSYEYESRGRENFTDYRLVTTSHGVRVESGVEGGRPWEKTANGLVLSDSPSLNIFDRSLQSALHRPDPHVRVLGMTEQSPREYVLEIRPNPRIYQRRYFDTNTLLLRRAVSEDYDGVLHTVQYSDYVSVCGKPVPSRVVAWNSLSPQKYETKLVRFEKLPLFDRRLVAMPRSRTPFLAQARLPATLNTLFEKSGILVRVDIRGTPYWLKLDSGAPTIMLDRDLVRRLGGREFGTYIGTKGGRIALSNAVLPRLDLGPVYAQNVVVGVLDRDTFEQGVEVVGLLGCDFIGSMPLAIDFRSQSATLGAALPSPGYKTWTAVSTPLVGCRPRIRTRIENEAAMLVLDLGASATTINEDLFGRIRDRLHSLDATQITFVAGIPLDAAQYVAPQATAGALNLGPAVVTVIANGRGQDLDNDGIFGRDLLERYQLILDYRHERTWFRRYAGTGDEEDD